MTKNPFINALAAVLYISLVASLMFYSSHFEDIEPSVIIPIGVLSLFVFSAAMMGYTLLYTPAQLLLEGKKTEALRLFLQTLLAFGAIALVIVVLGFYFIPPITEV